MRLPLHPLSLWAAGTITLACVMAFYFHPVKNPFGIGSDTYEYWHLSENLLYHKGFFYSDPSYYPFFDLASLKDRLEIPPRMPCTTRMPGYPLLLACGRAVVNSPWIVLVMSMFAYTGICFYGFRLGILVFTDAAIRRVYNVLLVFSPLYFVGWGVGSDLVAGVWLTGFTYHAFKQLEPGAPLARHTVMASLMGSATVFTRMNLLPYVVFVALGVIIIGSYHRRHRAWQAGVVIFLTLVFSLGVWGVRNQRLTGRWTLSTQGGPVLTRVHLIDIPDPTLSWTQERKKELFALHVRHEPSFNHAEARLNEELKSAVRKYYRTYPWRLGHQWIDGLRTFFLFSYHDISDLLVSIPRSLSDRLARLHSTPSAPRYTSGETRVQQILFHFFRFYRLGIALTFLATPLFFRRIRQSLVRRTDTTALLYGATVSTILLTALFTGAAGDRMRMPVNAPILVFSVLTGAILIERAWARFGARTSPDKP